MFWLRYKDAGDTTWTQQSFTGVDVRKIRTTDRLTGVTLRRKLYSHLLGKRYRYTIRISADEAVTHRDFLRDFLSANDNQYSELTSPDASNNSHGIYVVWQGGDEPITYLDDITDLPEYTLQLDEREGS